MPDRERGKHGDDADGGERPGEPCEQSVEERRGLEDDVPAVEPVDPSEVDGQGADTVDGQLDRPALPYPTSSDGIAAEAAQGIRVGGESNCPEGCVQRKDHE